MVNETGSLREDDEEERLKSKRDPRTRFTSPHTWRYFFFFLLVRYSPAVNLKDFQESERQKDEKKVLIAKCDQV